MKLKNHPESKKVSILRYLPVVIIILVVLVSHLYIALAPTNSMMRWFTVDDAYYYFKTAQNISEGKGVTFDGINAANGFHPLWMAVCIPVFSLARLDRILALRVLVVVMGILNAATGVMLYLLLKRVTSTLVAFITSFFWILFPGVISITSQLGMESGINAFFITLLLYLTSRYVYSKDQKKSSVIWIGITAALTILSRLDNIFIVGVIGLWLLLRDTRYSKYIITDTILAAIIMLTSCIIRMGFSIDYFSIQTAIYMMIFLAILLKPLFFILFKVDKEVQGKIWGIRWIRIISAVVASSVLTLGVMQGALLIKIITVYPRAALIYDLALSLLLFSGLRLITRRKWRDSEPNKPLFLWKDWIKTNWKRLLQEGMYFALPILILLGGYIIWNVVNFGVLTPISGQVKHWWSTITDTVYSHEVDYLTLMGFSPSTNFGPWSLVTSRLAILARDASTLFGISIRYYLVVYEIIICLFLGSLVGLTFFDKDFVKVSVYRSGALFLFLGALLHMSYYSITAYPNARSWYWVAQMLSSVIFGGIVLDAFLRWKIQNKVKRIVNYSLVGILFVLLAYYSINYLRKMVPPVVHAGQEQEYLSDSLGLESMTEEHSLIGMTGGGTIAYFINNRTIVNMDGLMNSSEYLKALHNWQAGEFLDNIGLDYVFGNTYMLFHSSPYRYFLPERIVEIGMIHGQENFTLYRYYVGGIP